MRNAFIKTVTERAAKDTSLFLLTSDTGFSVFEDFIQRYNDRFINTGIAEANMMSTAAGIALSGKTAITYSIIHFSVARCLEQIKIDICYHRCNVKILGV